MEEKLEDTRWALVLGASSGFGGAVSVALAEAGFNICGVHLDMRSRMAGVEEIIGRIKATGREAAFFNVNAADAEKRKDVLDAMESKLAGDGFRGSAFRDRSTRRTRARRRRGRGRNSPLRRWSSAASSRAHRRSPVPSAGHPPRRNESSSRSERP